ncbi:MAG: hypothetical protein J0653_05345 [Deltaproteobacteria bacterium]|nr:hypothetical protein [Deltaproteobacteria bacterium]
MHLFIFRVTASLATFIGPLKNIIKGDTTMSDEITTDYETSLTESALELFSNFSEILEYDLGCTKAHALKIFAFDLYTSSPTLFKDGNVNLGEIDSNILALVNQCSMTELRKIARVDRVENTATISEKLMAANMLLEGGNGIAHVEDVIELVVNGSNELIVAINTGNINAELIKTLEGGEFEYDGDEISETLESIASNSNCASICGYIENGLINSRDNLEEVVQSDTACVSSARLSC